MITTASHRKNDCVADEKDVESGESGDDFHADDENSLEDEDKDNDQQLSKKHGMALSMARILGTQQPTTSRSVVFSKTKTPLQKRSEQEALREKELKRKRQESGEKILTAFHEPLTVATSRTNTLDPSARLTGELEQERLHRRVATRGVVALFNAISQHQKNSKIEAEETVVISKKKESVSKMTKHAFLSMIKEKATTRDNDSTKTIGKAAEPQSKKQWSALNSETQWDQMSSSDDDRPTNLDE